MVTPPFSTCCDQTLSESILKSSQHDDLIVLRPNTISNRVSTFVFLLYYKKSCNLLPALPSLHADPDNDKAHYYKEFCKPHNIHRAKQSATDRKSHTEKDMSL
jgi:hypothetical protein